MSFSTLEDRSGLTKQNQPTTKINDARFFSSDYSVYSEESEEYLEEASLPSGMKLRSASTYRRKSVVGQLSLPTNTLRICWCFGRTKQVPALNLGSMRTHRKAIFYTCGSTGVIYDFENDLQLLLKGHRNQISCCCCSMDKKFIGTADSKKDCSIIVWDSHSRLPIKSIFDPYTNPKTIGAKKITMSHDSHFIAVLTEGIPQDLVIWEWTLEKNIPSIIHPIHESFGIQKSFAFHPQNSTKLVSNGDNQVIFYNLDVQNERCEVFAPILTTQDFGVVFGIYHQSVFVPPTTQAYSGTSLGCIVVWDQHFPGTGTENIYPTMRPIKVVTIQRRAITLITNTNKYVVTGDIQGHVRFYDSNLRMIQWFKTLAREPIQSIDFVQPPKKRVEYKKSPAHAVRGSFDTFQIQNFIVDTVNSLIVEVSDHGEVVLEIKQGHRHGIYAIKAHPFLTILAIGTFDRKLQIWDYGTKQLCVERKFWKNSEISCICFDPLGELIAVGFTNGYVFIINSITLENILEENFHSSDGVILQCCFSHDSQLLATSDTDRCVTVFKRNSSSVEQSWLYLGKHRSHYKPIRTIMFGKNVKGQPTLVSLGLDRMLIWYDLFDVLDELELIRRERVEQDAVPLCMTWYPPQANDPKIITSNDQYKFKLYNRNFHRCHKVALAPTYDSPIQKMAVLPKGYSDSEFLIFCTKERLGVQMLPADGNPYTTMSAIAHPDGVKDLTVSFDGQFVFTCGGDDSSIYMWVVDCQDLETASLLGGDGLEPFIDLLENEEDCSVLTELEDYFYYTQVQRQGQQTMEDLVASNTLLLDEIPTVMRALGYYPTQLEIETMLYEVKYKNYEETNEYVEEIDLVDFVQLFINYRPVFNITLPDIVQVFEVLGGKSTDEGPIIDSQTLVKDLILRGERMTERQLTDCLFGIDEIAWRCKSKDPYKPPSKLFIYLPPELTVFTYMDNILHLPMKDHCSGDIITKMIT